MAVFKCKMCGGTLEINNNETVATCEYCGTKQTLPKNCDDVVSNLFNRANNLRLKCEFDKAEQVYEKILELDNSESEAHWGIVLCKYGIEYVEDPKTYTRIPTCHRTSYDAILADSAYLSAIANADSYQKVIYEEEAKKINNIQHSILEVVKKEKPFDVFICYKETDEHGQRTIDSSLANDIYHQLTNEGFKVFYSAITLEDKLGEEYEPYIFAALNSAKVMLVIGTKPEYFESVWVKNEWSRFLKLIKTDRSKLLIPCYRNMDAYDLPEEFSHLQSQDMSKIGFVNDVVRGINKVLHSKENTGNFFAKEDETVDVSALIKRAYLYLEDEEWDSAFDNVEKVLNTHPDNANAYFIKLLIELKIKTKDDLVNCDVVFDTYSNYLKAFRFADAELKYFLAKCAKIVREKNQDSIYDDAIELYNSKDIENVEFASNMFKSIFGYKDAEEMYSKCIETIEELHTKKKKNKKKKKIAIICSITVVIIASICVICSILISPYVEYNNAVENLHNGDYYSAYLYFASSDFPDSKELMHEAQYGYINDNYYREDETTYQFLKELKDLDYKDSKELFDDLYAWEVTLDYCNTNPNDEETNIGSVPKKCSYYHMNFILSGGEPNKKITLYNKTKWPSGDVYTSSWYWEDCTDHSNLGILWNEGFSSTAGTFTIEFYDAETDKCIDRISLQVE